MIFLSIYFFKIPQKNFYCKKNLVNVVILWNHFPSSDLEKSKMKFDTLYTDMSYTILFLKYTECSNRHIILLILYKSTGVLILQNKRIFHAYRECQELLNFFGG